jgi:hypothetical protein
MVFANNAIFCSTGTAILVEGLGSALLSNNYVHGRLVGIAIDNRRCFEGGTPALAWWDAMRNDFWPRPGSPLLGKANATLAPPLDFNSRKRSSPFDVGAYEVEGQSQNPGWTIQPGFKP